MKNIIFHCIDLFYLLTKKRILISVFSLFFLMGCSTINTMNMVPIVDVASLHHSQKTILIGDIVGGEMSNEITGSKIDANSFKVALIQSIDNSGMFLKPANNQSPDFTLKAVLLHQDQPAMGLDMTVSLIVKYYLIDNFNNKEIWAKDINSVHTQTFSSACIGVDRLNKANEGAARENIKILLNELSKINL